MDWKELGAKVAEIGLPLLGAALPLPGGAALGSALAHMIGSGSEKPEDIVQLLSSNADALAKAKQFEYQHQETILKITTDAEIAQRQADSQDIKTVNESMQAEGKSEHWAQWSWRPYIGFCFGTAFLAIASLCCLLAYQAVLGGKPEALNMIPQLVGAFATLFAVPGAILGVTAWHRGRAQVELAKAA